ncbi:MAG: type VI secretion system tube protein Hcp [Verrucomicrobiae bacterium]|nr:type VI secretion system tube protein Hcp [Verrucomicrobiae bacterium]
MRTKLLAFISALFLVSIVNSPAPAFLKIGDIKGEAVDPDHREEIDILSWSWGESRAGLSHAGSGAGAGKVSMNDFHFTLKVNKATPKLMLACATGQHIPEAILTCRRAGSGAGNEPFTYLEVKFEDLLVSSYQTGGSSGDVVPTDQISFNFTKITFKYTVEATGEVVEAEFIRPPEDPTGAN